MSRFVKGAALLVLLAACSDPIQPTRPQFGRPHAARTTLVAGQGKILVAADEWALASFGYSQAPDAGVFARNVAAWFTGGAPGNFLAYSDSYGYIDDELEATMTAAGHTWLVTRRVPGTLATFLQYDAVFVGGYSVDQQALTDYVLAGGHVYLLAGTGNFGGAKADPAAEAAAWNPFLANFNMSLSSSYASFWGVLPISSSHPTMAGVGALYQDTGNPISILNPSDPRTTIIASGPGGGYYAAYDGAASAPPAANTPPTITSIGGPYAGVEGAAVSFSASATDADGNALTYSWAFGDGSIGTGSNPTHVYVDNGTYTATLTVSDGQASATSTASVVVANAAPVVAAGQDRVVVPGSSMLLQAKFSDPGTIDGPYSYSINWGDGTAVTTGSVASQGFIDVSHTYSTAGTFSGTVTVTDKDGASGSDAFVVTVRTVTTTTTTPAAAAVTVDVQPAPMGLSNTVQNARPLIITVAVQGTTARPSTAYNTASFILGTTATGYVPVLTSTTNTNVVGSDGLNDLVLTFDISDLVAHGLTANQVLDLIVSGRTTGNLAVANTPTLANRLTVTP